MAKNYRPKEIAPRLMSGDCRVSIGHGLPEEIREGLRAIARAENRSLSWVLENVVYDYFGMKRPKMKPRKKKPEDA